MSTAFKWIMVAIIILAIIGLGVMGTALAVQSGAFKVGNFVSDTIAPAGQSPRPQPTAPAYYQKQPRQGHEGGVGK